MKKILSVVALSVVFLQSCTKPSIGSKEKASSNEPNDMEARGNQPVKTGVITAAEWNDLNNWAFWSNLISQNDFSKMPSYWRFYNTNRIAVFLGDNKSQPLANVTLQLKKGNTTVFTARTDNMGEAELWPNLFTNAGAPDLKDYSIDVNNGAKVITGLKSFDQGRNDIFVDVQSMATDEINVSFVVDATGSMGDEIKYLKTEMGDVLGRVKEENPGCKVMTSSVFYRDEKDDYVTRESDFSENTQTTIDFLNKQEAGGGGDMPEAVHTALNKAVNEFKWTESAKTKIIFLVLDAPPHYKTDVVNNIQNSISNAAKKGIKIIPVLASGADKETEFLLRFMAISTNGTYVFITDDSGKGDKHMTASVGDYRVEYLNNLMARLINKYAE